MLHLRTPCDCWVLLQSIQGQWSFLGSLALCSRLLAIILELTIRAVADVALDVYM